MDEKYLSKLFLQHGYRRVGEKPLSFPPPETWILGDAGFSNPLPKVRTLQWHKDRRGALVEIHRNSWSKRYLAPDSLVHSIASGAHSSDQVYISATRPGVVKGWHIHAKQTDRFTCVRGSVMVALCDLRKIAWDMPLSIETHVLDCTKGIEQLVIPPGVAHGWKALDHSDGESWVMNVCSHEYDSTDEYRKDPRVSPAKFVGPVSPHASYSDFDWWATVDG